MEETLGEGEDEGRVHSGEGPNRGGIGGGGGRAGKEEAEWGARGRG